MKSLSLILALTSAAAADPTSYVNFVRQAQQGSGVVWDMPVSSDGAANSALLLESGGSLFQLWTVDQTNGKDYLLDQKIVGAYMPVADVSITTQDPYPQTIRTRVDKPFTVQIKVSNLFTGIDLPEASKKVLLEQHIQSYPAGQNYLDPTVVASNTPTYSATIDKNGNSKLDFASSSIRATDPTKALGEEHFIVHALMDGNIAQTQIASAKVQVWPVASGSITGIVPGTQYRYVVPPVQLDLVDLYPRSDTYFMLYNGTSVNSAPGIVVKSFPWTSDTTKTVTLDVTELNSKIEGEGTFTVALMSSTVYGIELLAPPITFSVKRTIAVNAMQVNFSDGATP